MKTPGRPAIFGLCFFFLALAAWGQPLRFVNLTVEDGLSDNDVEAVVQDHHGFIWLGTGDGLNRYDGYEFKIYRYDPGSPQSLENSHVTSLFVDHQDVLWVGTLNGLHSYQREEDTFHLYKNNEDYWSLSNNQVQALDEDADGGLWIGTTWGLNLLDRETGHFTRYLPSDEPGKGLSAPMVRSLLAGRDGNVWIGLEDGGLNRLDPASGLFTQYRAEPDDEKRLSNDDVWDIHEDLRGTVWVATHGGLHSFDRRTETFKRYPVDPAGVRGLSSPRTDTIFEDNRGRLWVGSDGGGISILDLKTDLFRTLRKDPRDQTSLGSDVIRTIYQDRIGDLWIGTYDHGVSFHNPETEVFSYYRHREQPGSLSDSRVLSFHEAEDGAFWVGTEGGLNLFDRARGSFQSFLHDADDPESLGANAVLSILEDRLGILWVGTFFGGLNRYHPEDKTFTRYQPQEAAPRSLSSSHVFALCEDIEGYLWIGTFGGVNRLPPDTGGGRGTEFTHYRNDLEDPTAVAGEIIWSILQDNTGRLWMGTNDGLSLFRPESNDFKNYRHDPEDPTSLSNDHVVVMVQDTADRLWLGTQGGLNLFDPSTGGFTSFRKADGLPNEIVLGVLDDGAGFLWLSTKEGLSRFDPESRRFTNYKRKDGLLAGPFTKKAAFKSRDGTLFFGGLNGFVSFRSETVRSNPHIPPVVLTEALILNDPVPIGPDQPLNRAIGEASSIRLSYEDRVLTLRFAALNYRSSEGNQYAYRLDPFDQGWNEVGDRRTATYTNLDAGTYQFRVRGSNNSGLWNEDGATLRVEVAPPYWETWWFRSLVALVVVGLILGTHMARIKVVRDRHDALHAEVLLRREVVAEREALLVTMEEQNEELEAKNAELERFTYTVSHDLKSPLFTIRGFVGMLVEDALAGRKERLQDDARYINEATDKMHRLLDELLELSRVGRIANPSETVSLHRIVDTALAQLEGEIQKAGVEVHVEQNLPEVHVDRLRMREVFQNLLENALKFMGEQKAPRIEIGASRREDDVLCWVRDNGMGIDPRYHDKVFGLFERLDASVDGTGVGLALVRRIVMVHGGRVWVESEGVGRGATFFLTLQASS